MTWIRGSKLHLEYEGLHSICFCCGKYGHKKDVCREILEVEEQVHSVEDGEETTKGDGTKTPAENVADVSLEVLKSTDINAVEKSAETSKLEMGPWSIVQGKEHRNPQKVAANKQGKTQQKGVSI